MDYAGNNEQRNIFRSNNFDYSIHQVCAKKNLKDVPQFSSPNLFHLSSGLPV